MSDLREMLERHETRCDKCGERGPVSTESGWCRPCERDYAEEMGYTR